MPKIICFIGCILWICCQFDLEWEKAVIRANKYLVHITSYHPSPMKFYNQDVLFMNNPYYANLFNELHPPVQLFVVNHLYGKKALIPERTLKEVFGDNRKPMLLLHIWIMRRIQWFIITFMPGRRSQKHLLTFAWPL